MFKELPTKAKRLGICEKALQAHHPSVSTKTPPSQPRENKGQSVSSFSWILGQQARHNLLENNKYVQNLIHNLMGNLTEVYSTNNVPQNNQKTCFFVLLCFLKLHYLVHNTKEARIYLFIQLLIETNTRRGFSMKIETVN